MTGSSGEAVANAVVADDITKAEAEIYDRQIRLWGLDAQNRLRASSVLIYGLSGLGAEVTKNLMLCGLKAVTLMDEKLTSEADGYANFLLAVNSVGQNRASSSAAKAQVLNPMVSFSVEECSLESKPEEYVNQFTLVVLIDQSYETVDKWNAICRKFGVRFMAGSVYGWTGYSFFDFNNHEFLMKVAKQQATFSDLDLSSSNANCCAVADTVEEDTFEKKALPYASFGDAFNVDWMQKKYIRKAKRLVPPSYFPIRAILRAEQESAFTGDEAHDQAKLVELWKQEVAACNQDVSSLSLTEDKFDYFFGEQLSAVCAIVGGVMGQEAIKAISQNEHPLRNIYLYSALDTTGIVVSYPPA